MEAPAPVGTRIPGPVDALDLLLARLRGERCVGVDRMLVAAPHQDARRVDVGAAVEGDHERRVHLQPLQQVHAVADRAAARGVRGHVRVPCRPRLAMARQHAGIGMQDGVVVLVGNRRQDLALALARIVEQAQCLSAVAGEHDLVEALDALVAAHAHAVGVARHPADGGAQPHLDVPSCGHRIHVAARAALHHPPRRAPADLQHVVVGHELHQVAGREAQDSFRGGGPQRAGHRHQVELAEGRAIAVRAQVIAQRGPHVGGLQQAGRLAIEPAQVAQHAPEARREQVAALAKQRVQVGCVVLQAAGGLLHREAHRGRLARHAELVEKPSKQRIVHRVVDDEAGVHLQRPPLDLHRVGIGMPAEVVIGLVQHDLVLAREQPRSRQPADPTSDHRDAHLSARPGRRRPSPIPTPAPA